MPVAKPVWNGLRPLKSLLVPIGDLRPDPENARTHSERNVEIIVNSLRRFGQHRLAVYRAGGIVQVGNAMLEAARRVGWTHLAAIDSGDDAQMAKARALVDNRSGDPEVGSEWDLSRLAAQLQDLQKLGENVDLLGWTASEFADLMPETPGPDESEGVPEVGQEPVIRKGEIVELGAHRLMCGDSAREPDVQLLLGGRSMHMVYTDPPYNVSVEPRTNNAIRAAGKSALHHQKFDKARAENKRKSMPRQDAGGGMKATGKMRPRDRALKNDFVSDADFEAMLLAWFGNLSGALKPGGAFYIWGGYANCVNYPPAIKASKLYFAQAVIWVKQHPVLTRKDFMGDHEWCFYGWKEGAGHYFNPEITNATDVWTVKKVNPRDMVHLTEKPVELATRAMLYSCKRGENVLDLFGGSGSALIAAEQMGRCAFLMELDELYCDVIVRRFFNYVGWDKASKAQRKRWRDDAPAK